MKIGIYLLAALLLIGLVSATVESTVNAECQENLYDYGISKWACTGGFAQVDAGTYPAETATVAGDCSAANWEVSTYVDAVVVKNIAGETQVFAGGSAGNVAKWNDFEINSVLFCSYGGSSKEVASFTVVDNEVPEFSTLTLGIAVLTATMGMVYLRKR